MNELKRRLELWEGIKLIPTGLVEPTYLREKKIYGGAQGIYTDKEQTKSLTKSGKGVTVSILHIGDHYPDELSDDGLICHYPNTNRPATRDKNEIEATKACLKLNLPIFVILEGKKKSTREVKLGWVLDFDGQEEIFLIDFNHDKPIYLETKEEDFFMLTYIETKEEDFFTLALDKKTGEIKTKTRPEQRKFRYQIIKNYGYKCAVCSIEHPRLLDAAHIRDKEEKGSDDWRNGLFLCRNHHAAFDNHLFRINPKDFSIKYDEDNIKIEEKFLKTKKGKFPHKDALIWRWEQSK